MHWLCFALFQVGARAGALPQHPQHLLRSRKLDSPARGSLLHSVRAHMWCWALQAAVHVVARAGAIHGILNWVNGNAPSSRCHLPQHPLCPPHTVGQGCQSYRLSQTHRSSLRRTATSAVADGGWPRALDLVHPSCCCSGSDCSCSTFIADFPLHGSRRT
jgi:hypothetical protein